MSRVRSVQDTPEILRHRIVAAVSTAFAADAAAVTIDMLRTERSATLRQLDEHLAQHPDALVSGDPHCGHGTDSAIGTGPPPWVVGWGGAMPAAASARRPCSVIHSVVQAGASAVRTTTSG